ncbi:MAG: hypothetical protein JST90_05325 [Bacteroidetes bacterium]|nr:hypothetical protein [Bacteroidota bacterium]
MNTLTKKVRNLDLLDPFGYPVYEGEASQKGQQPAPAPKPNDTSSGGKK